MGLAFGGTFYTWQTNLGYAVSVVFTVVINVTLVNLTIAYVGDIYNRVQEDRKQAEFEIKCRLLTKPATLMILLNVFSDMTTPLIVVRSIILCSPFIVCIFILYGIFYVIFLYPTRLVLKCLGYIKTYDTFEGGE
jgi:hypothetical protein